MSIYVRFSPFALRFVVILLLMMSFFSAVYSQDEMLATKSKKAIKLYSQAKVYYQQRKPEQTIGALTKALEADSLFTEGWLLYGDVLQEVKKPDLALEAYKKAVAIDSVTYPQLYFTMGKLAYNQADYGLSATCYRKYRLKGSLDSIGELRVAAEELKSVKALQLTANPLPVSVENCGQQLNTPADEFVNFITADNEKLVMTRKIKRESIVSERPVFDERFYFALSTDSSWSTLQPLNLPWLSVQNVGGMSMSADGRSMLFTGCYWPEGQGSCDIYYSNRVGHDWQNPVAFNTRINTSGWESQPVISADGKTIYFSSKRPGGKGGADIWQTNLSETGWSSPVNLGDSINTEGDEMAPTIHGDGQSLYFSSNGHSGLGGYDLFYSSKDGNGSWSGVRNLGYPINSQFDEVTIFVSLTGNHAWISSNRAGGFGGMDIWEFDLPHSLLPQPVILLAGIVVDSVTNGPLDAEVEIVTMPAAIEIRRLTSDKITGEFLVVLNSQNTYVFNIYKSGYLFYSEKVMVQEHLEAINVKRVYALQPVKAGLKMNLYNVFFDFNSDQLQAASKPELDRVVALLTDNPIINVAITGHTDSIGSSAFNLTLSLQRAKSVVAYLVDQGIDPQRLSAFGVGDTRPMASNQSEQGRALNRRTEIEIK